METVRYEGQTLPRDCVICDSRLDYWAAERDQGDSFALAEAHDPVALETLTKTFALTHPHDGRTPYEVLVEKGKAGVVHATCMNDKGWELS